MLTGLVAAASPAAPPADAADVVARLRDHPAAVTSVRYRSTERQLAGGGVRTPDPASAARTYSPGALSVSRHVWIDPPHQRKIEERREPGDDSHVGTYFDGSSYTHLDHTKKSALKVADGGSRMDPPDAQVLRAIGFAYAATTKTQLGSVFADPRRVSARLDGTKWLIEAKGLPSDVRPQNRPEDLRDNAITQVWVSSEPEFTLDRWAYYLTEKYKPDATAKPVPAFPCPPGTWLGHCYVNSGTQRVANERWGGFGRVPSVIVQGNPYVNAATVVHLFVYDPRPAAATFAPLVPPGWAVTRVGRTAETQVAGGPGGEVVRVGESTDRAKAMLAGGEAVRAEGGWPVWAVTLVGAMAMAVAGVAVQSITKSARR